jgi:hypothetical protein
MALGSTQPVTEMITRNISWGGGVGGRGKGGRCVGLTTLPPSCARLSRNLAASTSWNTKGLSRPVMGLLYLQLSLDVFLCIVYNNEKNYKEMHFIA